MLVHLVGIDVRIILSLFLDQYEMGQRKSRKESNKLKLRSKKMINKTLYLSLI